MRFHTIVVELSIYSGEDGSVSDASDNIMQISRWIQGQAIVLSALGVFGQWGFWTHGVYSLGINTSFVCLLLVIFLYRACQINFKQHWAWLTPLILMALSFSLYENPWVKAVNLGVLPLALIFLFANLQLISRRRDPWTLRVLVTLLARQLKPVRFIVSAVHYLLKLPTESEGIPITSILWRIGVGLLVLLPIGIMVTALLSMVDPRFEQLVADSFSFLFAYIDWAFLLKVCLTLLGGVLLLAGVLAWTTPMEEIFELDRRGVDDLVACIVLCGILVIYIAFLGLQANHLVVGELPFDYSQAEHLVKSGFWQLLLLTAINIFCFLVLYRATKNTAQILLNIFVAASGLIIISAAWRMVLYNYTYGLSYEKFFAGYTVIFALIVFVYLLIAGCVAQHKNVGRFITFAALWAYAVATVFPVEKTIFYTNLHFSTFASSRILTIQLSQLSLDVLDNVKKELIPDLLVETGYQQQQELIIWKNWVRKQELDRCSRPWYQSNIRVILYCP